jgi:ferritin
MTTILWQIIIFLLPIVLDAAKNLLQKIMKLVDEANTKSDMTGTQKREWVVSQIKEELAFSEISTPLWMINVMLEIAVSYFKTKGTK